MLLFDFDQVLVNTEPIAHLRKSGQWNQYKHLVSELDPCTGIDQLLNSALDCGHSLAIVTQSPGFVPKLFVKKQGWPIQNIVGWHDYRRRKPNPLCLLVSCNEVEQRLETPTILVIFRLIQKHHDEPESYQLERAGLLWTKKHFVIRTPITILIQLLS